MYFPNHDLHTLRQFHANASTSQKNHSAWARVTTILGRSDDCNVGWVDTSAQSHYAQIWHVGY